MVIRTSGADCSSVGADWSILPLRLYPCGEADNASDQFKKVKRSNFGDQNIEYQIVEST